MNIVLWYVQYVAAWFRHHGWNNTYWQEDFYQEICDHAWEVVQVVGSNNLSAPFCIWCGKERD